MSMKRTSSQTANEHAGLQPPRRTGATDGLGVPGGPHFASRPPQVVARLPDLESAESPPCDAASRDGRLLGSALSVKILAAAGVFLVIAALALPFLLRSSEPADADSAQTSPAWEVDVPAPSAPLAPAWDASSGTANWQSGPGTYGADTSALPAYSDDSRWGVPAPPPSESWEGAAGTGPTYSSAPLYGAQPEHQPWAHQPQAMTADRPAADSRRTDSYARDAQSDWQRGYDTQAPPAWNSDPLPSSRDTATTSPLTGRSAPQADYRGEPDPYRSTTGQPWAATAANEPSRASSAGQAPYQGAYSATDRGSDPSYGAYLPPRADSNRAMTIDNVAPARDNYTVNPYVRQESEYRTADTRAGADASRWGDDRAGSRSSRSDGVYAPGTGSWNSGSQADDSGASPSTGAWNAGSQADYPTGRYAPASGAYSSPRGAAPETPSGWNPPNAEYSPSSPTSGYLPSYSPSVDRARDSSAPSWGTGTTAPDYRSGAASPNAEPPVARFQGGIERVTENNSYDPYRPSLY